MFKDIPSAGSDKLFTNPEISLNIDIASHLRRLTNAYGEIPCREAQVSLETISNPMGQLHASATYVLNHQLEYIRDSIHPYCQAHGIDIFNLDGIVTIREPGSDTVFKIAPPIVAVNENDQYQIIDGLHRIILADLLGIPIKIAIIRGVGLDYLTAGNPLPISRVRNCDSFPRHHRQKSERPQVDRRRFMDFSSLGSRGQRVSDEVKEERFHTFTVSIPLKDDRRQLAQEVVRTLKKLRLSGFFPNVYDTSQQLDPDPIIAGELVDVRQLSSDYFLPEILFKYSYDGKVPETKTPYHLIAETRRHRLDHAAKMVCVVPNSDPQIPILCDPNLPIKDLVNIPPFIVQSLNQSLAERGLRSFVPHIPSTLDASKSPTTTGFTVEDANSKFYSIFILTKSDGNKIPILINHSKEHRDRHTPVEGTIFCARMGDQYLLVDRYRETLGVKIRELPRGFADSFKRFLAEVGLQESDFRQPVNNPRRIVCDRSFDHSLADIEQLELLPNVKLPQIDTSPVVGDTREISRPVLVSAQTAFDQIAAGKVVCDFTVTTLTIDMLQRDEITLSPEFENQSVLLEVSFSPVEGSLVLKVPEGSRGSGIRFGHNSFPNDGNSLIYRHTEITSPDSLPLDRRYLSLPLNKLREYILTGSTEINGQLFGSLDSTSIAHLSRTLAHQGNWRFSLPLSPPN